MTHTEHVHLLFGIGLALTGALWLGSQLPGARRLRYVWPLVLFAVGFFLVISTETQERTYVPVGAWDTFLSVFPNSPDVWLASVQKFHVIQHKLTGVFAMVAAVIEESRACGRLTAPRWRWALPVLTIAAGLAIGIHGGTHQHLPRLVERAHHWILGGALVLGGVVQLVATGRPPANPIWLRVLPALVMLAGLDLALLYRLH
jgi:hypothetical protein